MKWFRLRVEFDGPATDREDALAKVQEIFDGVGLHNMRFDAQEIPNPQPVSGNHQVRHVWEDGLHIFPEDHPLREYEEQAYEEWVSGGRSEKPPTVIELVRAHRELGEGDG